MRALFCRVGTMASGTVATVVTSAANISVPIGQIFSKLALFHQGCSRSKASASKRMNHFRNCNRRGRVERGTEEGGRDSRG